MTVRASAVILRLHVRCFQRAVHPDVLPDGLKDTDELCRVLVRELDKNS